MRKFIYNDLNRNWKTIIKFLKVYFILISIIIISAVPSLLLLDKLFPSLRNPQKDISATFVVYYDSPLVKFGTIDYSGIENDSYLKNINYTSWMVYQR